MAETVHPSGRTDGLDRDDLPAGALPTPLARTKIPRHYRAPHELAKNPPRRPPQTLHDRPPADTGDQPAPSRHPRHLPIRNQP